MWSDAQCHAAAVAHIVRSEIAKRLRQGIVTSDKIVSTFRYYSSVVRSCTIANLDVSSEPDESVLTGVISFHPI